VAIFHLCAHDRVSRSDGQSSLASAAYIMRAQFTDERTGRSYDYRHLDAPQWIGMFSPKDAPAWTRDPANASRFFNALELFEKRKDAQIALPLDIALPHELTLQQKIWLATDYIRETFTRHGYVVLAAIHPPDHDERNVHLHVLVSLRKIDAHGFARTKTEQQENYRNRDAYIENLRERWESLANRHLERHGIDARIDRRSLQEQGIEREPQKHRGPTKSAVVALEEDRVARPAAVAEIARLEAQIIDLDAKRSERGTRPGQGGPRAGDLSKAPDMPERTNDNDAYKGAENYIDACTAEFERQAEAARGLPDPFRPPQPTNENERQAFKLWLGELEQQMGGPVDIAPETLVVLGRPLELAEENPHLEYRPPPPANQNQRGKAELGSPERDAAVMGALHAIIGSDETEKAAPQTPAAPEPLTLEAIRRDPWNAVTLNLPDKAAPELYAAVAETAMQLYYTPDAERPPMPFPAPENDDDWVALGEEIEARWQKAAEALRAVTPGMETAERQAAKPGFAGSETPEPPSVSAALEQANSATDGPQPAAQEKAMTSDPVDAGAPTFFARAESFVSGFFNEVADYVGSAITYLSDLIAPPPVMPPEQVEDAVQRANEATEFAAYRSHVPGYDPADHQDSETRQTSERDHDRAPDRTRGVDLEPD
jgi:hypothetical protein